MTGFTVLQTDYTLVQSTTAVWQRHYVIIPRHDATSRDLQKTDHFPIQSKSLLRPHSCPCRQQSLARNCVKLLQYIHTPRNRSDYSQNRLIQPQVIQPTRNSTISSAQTPLTSNVKSKLKFDTLPYSTENLRIFWVELTSADCTCIAWYSVVSAGNLTGN